MVAEIFTVFCKSTLTVEATFVWISGEVLELEEYDKLLLQGSAVMSCLIVVLPLLEKRGERTIYW